MLSTIDRAVLKTLAYFDLFDYPLTVVELHRFLIIKEPTSFGGTLHAIQNVKNLIDSRSGFYFLKNREAIIETRRQRYLLAEEKYLIALKNIKLLSHCPGILAIFVCNSLAYNNSRAESDLDLAIITNKNRIWTARFFAAALMKLLHRRPTPENSKNKICLSFFLSEEDLNSEKFAYADDIHFAFWLRQFYPVFDPENYYAKIQKENEWAGLPNFFGTIANDRRKLLKKRKAFNFFGRRIENLLKRWQVKRLPAEIRGQLTKENKNVVANDKILKLHTHDNREELNRRWREQCQKLIPPVDPVEMVKLLLNR
jgi:hypothetical protein